MALKRNTTETYVGVMAVAGALGVSRSQVLQLINKHSIPCAAVQMHKVGYASALGIRMEDLKKLQKLAAQPVKRGRPTKQLPAPVLEATGFRQEVKAIRKQFLELQDLVNRLGSEIALRVREEAVRPNGHLAARELPHGAAEAGVGDSSWTEDLHG